MRMSMETLYVCVRVCYSFTRVGMCILVLHYTVEMVFHLSRLLYFSEKSELANAGLVVLYCAQARIAIG